MEGSPSTSTHIWKGTLPRPHIPKCGRERWAIFFPLAPKPFFISLQHFGTHSLRLPFSLLLSHFGTHYQFSSLFASLTLNTFSPPPLLPLRLSPPLSPPTTAASRPLSSPLASALALSPPLSPLARYRLPLALSRSG